MAGALYFWIMLAVFTSCAGVMGLLIALLWLGHKWEKRRTGATHDFLEPPAGSQSRPAPRSDELPPEPPAARS
jgi:hypothetical protein